MFELFAAALQQGGVHGQRIGLHKIRRAGDAAGVDGRIFIRINRAGRGLQSAGCAAMVPAAAIAN